MKIKKEKKLAKKPGKVLSAKKKKKSLSEVSTDEFFDQDFDSDESVIYDDSTEAVTSMPLKDYDSDKDNDSGDSDLDPGEHKKSLKRLKDTDPEFYSYLKENDKNLLDFKVSDDDDDDDDNEENDAKLSDDDIETKHVPADKLEVASDESDFEPEDGVKGKSGDSNKITLQLLKQWQNEIQQDKSSRILKYAVEAFHAAVLTVNDADDQKLTQFKVEGSAVFNGVVQLCILYLPDAFKRFLKCGGDSQVKMHDTKRFKKIKGLLKGYLADLIKILQSVTSANIQTVLLKHLHQMLPFTLSFSSLVKPLLKILLKLWSRSEETVRVVAFLCILRIATSHTESVLEILLKTMYIKYVENSKFVSPTTLPGINFMRHSLAEIYSLDTNASYNHAFLYIRQLAIHLRNAIVLKKKENFQAVYNWQYLNSLRFWAELLSASDSQSMLRSLLYPLIQIIIGTIKVIPTAQYYPLRFHCVKMLITISKKTGVYIPIMPFLLEILNSYDFNKKHKTVSMKPVSLMCIFRISKSQLQENGFKDSIIETIYELMLENAANDSHTIYFPDLYIPCIIQLKAFLKKCRVANYCRKIKQLLDKIEENRKFIETERAKQVFELQNTQEIAKWEKQIKNNGTSLAKFFDSWIKIHQSQKLKLLTMNDKDADYNLPTIKRTKKKKLDEDDETESDDDDDESDFELRIKGEGGEDGEEESNPKARRGKRGGKKRKKIAASAPTTMEDDTTSEVKDIITDTKTDDWD